MSTSKTVASIQIEIPTDKISALCQRHHIRELAFFGSVLRPDFSPDSDIDVLVEFEPDAGVGYLKFFEIQDELEDILGRKVDLGTPGGIKPHIKDEIISKRVIIYAV
jgi:hypothetical protein